MARTIFEEVGTAPRPAAPPSTIDRDPPAARRALRVWLSALFLLVVAMIIIGGLTRLTDSGLSITEWKPVTGAIPPLSAADWQSEFDLYRSSPQYELMNRGMELDEFKFIYWWEWGHRFLGRVVGLVWAVGFAGLALRRQVPPGWAPRLWLIGVLIGLQGAIGWWMVHSGLQDGMVSVASTRLATHLGLAFIILGLLAWMVMRASRSEAALMAARRQAEPGLRGMTTGLMHLTFVQVVIGALVAGIDAGRAFPTWPLMGDTFVPPDLFAIEPVWRNLIENPGLVQFVHRMTGYLLAIFAVVAVLRLRRSPHRATRRVGLWIALAVVAQVGLGIWAVLSAAQLHVAITHQAVAVVLWVLVIRARHLAVAPVVATIRG